MTRREQCAFAMLGVSPDDDAATIRRAWRHLVRCYHPDSVRGDKQAANARLAALNAAYDVVLGVQADDARQKPGSRTGRRRQRSQSAAEPSGRPSMDANEEPSRGATAVFPTIARAEPKSIGSVTAPAGYQLSASSALAATRFEAAKAIFRGTARRYRRYA